MKKGYKLLIVAFIIAVAANVIPIVWQKIKQNRLEKHVIPTYSFEISYPKSFEEVKEKSLEVDGEEQISSNISIMVSGESVDDYMKNINMTENVVNVIDKNRHLRMLVDAINIPKASLPLEEICKRYVVMFRIYNEDAKIISKEHQIVSINGIDVGKVMLTIKGEAENSRVIAYLFSLADKEITLTFIMPESKFPRNDIFMNKIAKSIKNVETPN